MVRIIWTGFVCENSLSFLPYDFQLSCICVIFSRKFTISFLCVKTTFKLLSVMPVFLNSYHSHIQKSLFNLINIWRSVFCFYPIVSETEHLLYTCYLLWDLFFLLICKLFKDYGRLIYYVSKYNILNKFKLTKLLSNMC